MADPILMAVAAAIAGKAAESLTEAAGQALGKLTARVRAAFRDRPADQTALDTARQEPDSPERVAELAAALESAARDDPTFGADLRALWEQVQIQTTVSGDGVANVVHGDADKIVQLRDVHGDLNIG